MYADPSATAAAAPAIRNPLLDAWNTPFGAPPFAAIEPAHFRPAFERALAEHRDEIEAIAGDPAGPSFANTVEALERSGRPLQQVSAVFFNVTRAHGNAALEEIERDIAPILARHWNGIYLNETLFRRVVSVHERRDRLGLEPEQARVLDRYHTIFVRNGAALPPAAKRRLAEIGERLATLGTRFCQNVLADEQAYALVLENEADLAGLPGFLRGDAAEAAAERGLAGKHAITLSRSIVEPFLQYSRRRDLREAAWRAWAARGENLGESDNRLIAKEMVALRGERARLLGYASHADFRLEDCMAKTPQAALDLCRSIWRPARAKALADQEKLQALIGAEGGNFELRPWDWRYYAERRARAELNIDEEEVKPFLRLDQVIEAAFYTAGRLFGLTFTPRDDAPVYHPDVRAWQVSAADGNTIGLFYGDYFARAGKRSGAWAGAYRVQEKLGGDIRPIVVNVMNFAKAAEGAPALLSFEDARTLFHEFGHALHALLSDVTYPMISGTNVARDFVEFPSQLFEHWLQRPEVLTRYALHYKTGMPMPKEMLRRIIAARRLNQAFASVEYLACALFDLELHGNMSDPSIDIPQFERELLKKIDMPKGIVMRHRPMQFMHIFTADGYSAGYYSYLWSEVLDADGFAAFEEAGDPFHPEVAKRLYEFVYSAGNRCEPADAYVLFRGRAPDPEALLRKRGLLEPHGGQEP